MQEMKRFSRSSNSDMAHMLRAGHQDKFTLLLAWMAATQCQILNLNLAWKAVFKNRKWKHQLEVQEFLFELRNI